jgi:hypothetical protein
MTLHRVISTLLQPPTPSHLIPLFVSMFVCLSVLHPLLTLPFFFHTYCQHDPQSISSLYLRHHAWLHFSLSPPSFLAPPVSFPLTHLTFALSHPLHFVYAGASPLSISLEPHPPGIYANGDVYWSRNGVIEVRV